MFRKCLIIIAFVFLPHLAFAIDLSKGLLESSDNWSNRTEFIRGGADLMITPLKSYPVPTSSRRFGRSLNFSLSTDKEVYQAGDSVQMKISVKNDGFSDIEGNTKLNGKKIFSLWSEGNFYVEIYRLSDEIKDGELLVASGMAFSDDFINVYQGENKVFEFSWKIPDDFKRGDYEVRVFPSCKNIFFLGAPNVYRTLLKNRLIVENKEEREKKLEWKLDELKLGTEIINPKDQVVRLKAGESYTISVPIKNTSNEQKEVVVIKQIRGYQPAFGTLLSQEKEILTLKSGEIQLIEFIVNKSNFQDKPNLIASMSFVEDNNKPLSTAASYADHPITERYGESIVVPLYFIGNVGYAIRGMGIATVEDQTIFKANSNLTIFMEVERFDRLFYESSGTKRDKEDNLNISLTLLDQNGSKIDEIGYDGPSWDRSGQIYKRLQLNGNHGHLKLVGVLRSKDKGEIERKEIEFLAPGFSSSTSWFGRLKEILENWVVLTISAILISACLAILATILIMRKRKQISNNINL